MMKLLVPFARGLALAAMALSFACSKYEAPDGGGRIGLRPVVERFEVNPNDAQTLLAESGVGVAFGANSLVRPDGSAPSDSATIELAKYLHADDPRPTDMPGGFRGLGTDGRNYALVSFGVMGIEITDSNGDELNLADGSTAELTIPSLASASPDSVPLWNLSPADLWLEEGSAQRQGSAFVGTVSHFSLWNVDGKCSEACMRGSVRYKGENLVQHGVQAETQQNDCIDAVGAQSGSVAYTDFAGDFTLIGLASPASVLVSIDYKGEHWERTVAIPATGESCIDLGIINLGTPDEEDPTTGNPTTGNPTTGNPTTGNPTTGNPTTGNPTTAGGCDDPVGLTDGYWSASGGYDSFTDYKFYCDETFVRYYRVYEVGNSSCNGVVEEIHVVGSWSMDNPTPGTDSPISVMLGGESATWTFYNTGNTIFLGPEANVQNPTLNRSELADPWLPNGGNDPTTAPRGQMPVGCSPPPNW